MSTTWKREEFEAGLALVREGLRCEDVAKRLTARFGRPFSLHGVRQKFAPFRGDAPRPTRRTAEEFGTGFGRRPPAAADTFPEEEPPTNPRGGGTRVPERHDTDPALPAANGDHERFEKLVEIARRSGKRGVPLTLEALCDELRKPPADVRAFVEEAISAGYALDVLDGDLAFRKPEPNRLYVPVTAPYEPGAEHVLGVASDWHVASKHFEADAFRRHIDYLISEGVTDIIAPGDLVAGGGRYRFLQYEVTKTGIEDQSEEAAELLASTWGDAVRWHAIAGNHDESFDVGIDAARMIQRHLQDRGLSNFHYYGARGGRIVLYGTRIEMWHPGGSLSYALTYKAQRHVDATAPEDRPHFLFVGHFHQAIYFRRGGVHVFLCGTFENGDSAFGRMIGGDVALGSWLVRYRLGSDDQIAELTTRFREYPQTKMQWVAAAIP